MKMDKEKNVIPFKILILTITAIWILSAILGWLALENWGVKPEYSETFNIINSLFSGLALAAIIYTVYLQRKELTFQREELRFTREELKRTAAAQEDSAKSMVEQMRLSNFPYLECDSAYLGEEKCITISNKNENVAFDVDIYIFSFIAESYFPYDNFIRKYVIERYKNDLANLSLLDDTLWGLTERGHYSSISKNRQIIIPFNFPIDQGNYSVFIQYRDILGNNYSNNFDFTEFENYETTEDRPFSGIRVYPDFPQLTERIDFSTANDIEEKHPPYIQGIIKSKRASINLNFTTFKEFRSNNFKWIMD